VYNTDITVRQVYFFTVRLLNLSRSLCFLFRVLCSYDGRLPFGRWPRWIYLERTGCPCLRYVQIVSYLIPEMRNMFFQSVTALSSWIRMDLVIIGDVSLRLEIDLLTGRVCSPTQTKIHQEEIWFVLCTCSHKQGIKLLRYWWFWRVARGIIIL